MSRGHVFRVVLRNLLGRGLGLLPSGDLRRAASDALDEALEHLGRFTRRFAPEVLGDFLVVRVSIFRGHHIGEVW
jgi:hypothetical protein